MGKRKKRTRNKHRKTVRIEGYGISHAVIDEAHLLEGFGTMGVLKRVEHLEVQLDPNRAGEPKGWGHPDATSADIIRDIQRVRDSYRNGTS